MTNNIGILHSQRRWAFRAMIDIAWIFHGSGIDFNCHEKSKLVLIAGIPF